MSKISLMVKWLTKAAVAVPLVLTATVSYSGSILAQTPSSTPSNATEAGCLSGYPDGTYRGDRPITRYEFAAGLNACLEGVNQLLPFNRDNLATRTDFEALIERQKELNQQLRELNQRVENPSSN